MFQCVGKKQVVGSKIRVPELGPLRYSLSQLRLRTNSTDFFRYSYNFSGFNLRFLVSVKYKFLP